MDDTVIDPPTANPPTHQMVVTIDPVPGMAGQQMIRAGLDPSHYARVIVPVIGHQLLPSTAPDHGLDLVVQCHMPSRVLSVVSPVVDPATRQYRVANAIVGLSVAFDVLRPYVAEAAAEALARGDAREAAMGASWEICRRLWQKAGMSADDAAEIFAGLPIEDELAAQLVLDWCATPAEPAEDDADTWGDGK